MVFLVIILLLDKLGRMGWMRSIASWGVGPVARVMSSSVGSVYEQARTMSQWNKLAKRNVDLERQLTEAQVIVNQATQLKNENEQLRHILDVKEKQKFVKVLGKVTQATSSSYRLWLDNFVPAGSAVMYQDQLVGVVGESRGQIAMVDKIGFGKGQVGVKVGQSSGVSSGNIVASGMELTIAKIPPTSKIEIGALVDSVGNGDKIPADLPIAKIKEVLAPPEAVFQTLKLTASLLIAVGDTVWVIVEGTK